MPTKSRESIVLVLSADDHYAQPMAVTIFSLLENLGQEWSVRLFLLDGGILPHHKNRIEHIVSAHSVDARVHWASVSETELSAVPFVKLHEDFSRASLLRLWIPDLLPADCSKAIYLDSDILVEGDVSVLWQRSLASKSLMAVRDYWIPFVSSPNGISYYDEIGVDPLTPYFNSGVMVINVERWRTANVHDKAMNHLVSFANHLSHNDQEALNAVLIDDWIELDPKWNVHHDSRYEYWKQKSAEWPESDFKNELMPRIDKLIADPNIFHFTGSSKPWKHPHEHPEGLRWFRYLWNSGWLTKTERLRSMTHFYARRATKTLRIRSRPYRHQLAGHLPRSLQRLLRRHAD